MAPVVITAKLEWIRIVIMEDPINKTSAAEESDQTSGKADSDLKSIRESKGITLNDVFERTRISAINLEAIEKGDFHLLPPPFLRRHSLKPMRERWGSKALKSLRDTMNISKHLKNPLKKWKLKLLRSWQESITSLFCGVYPFLSLWA
jgi:hypothetical protein